MRYRRSLGWRGAMSILIVSCLGVATAARADLALYGTTEDERVVANAPHRDERIPPSPQSLTGSIYIERTNPKIRVEDGDIESVAAFLNKRGDQRFGLRFGKTTLGVIRAFGPLEGNELEEAFASAIDNVVWK